MHHRKAAVLCVAVAVGRQVGRGKATQKCLLSLIEEQKDKETESPHSSVSVTVLTSPENNSSGKTAVGYCL